MATETEPKLTVFDAEGALVEIEGEQIKPNPMVWPVCSTCGNAYVLRRCWSFAADGPSNSWAWMRDCDKPRSTCKNASAVLHDAKGECPGTGREAMPS